MCGYDLRVQPHRKQRVSLVDVLLVLAVFAVLVIWWQIGGQPQQDAAGVGLQAGILPTDIPRLGPTPTLTSTPLPTPTPLATVAQPVNVTHEVQSGETLIGIASFYGITVEELQAANGLSDVLIRPGDSLIVPLQQPLGGAGSLSSAQPTRTLEYVVESGDTVYSIALRFGSSEESILQASNLGKSDLIRPGDTLKVPVTGASPEVIDSSKQAAPSQPAAETPGVADAPAATIYTEPRLIGPPDNATLPRSEVALLRWVSVDVLAPNEWYVLLVYPASENARTFPSIWLKTTSYRLETELAPGAGQSAAYAWQVSVVRVKTGAGGQTLLEAASPTSSLRRFTWQ